jgi:hypothetical protein
MNANDFPPELLSQQQARRAAAQESEKSRPSAPVPNSDVLFRQEVYRIQLQACETGMGKNRARTAARMSTGGLLGDSRSFAFIRG